MKGKPRRKVLVEGRFMQLVREANWEWAERTNNSGVVAVTAITADGRLVLTEQYRTPVAARTLDLAAGLSGDDPGARHEELSAAARRELLEETGFEADEFEYLTEGPSSAGLSNEVVTFFLARNARQVTEGGGDQHEDIQVHVVPLAEIDSWLEAKRQAGVMVDPKIYTGLYFVRRRIPGLVERMTKVESQVTKQRRRPKVK